MKKIIDALDIPEVTASVQVMLAGGMDRAQVANEIAALADGLIPAHLLAPPWGVILEAADGVVLRLIARAVVARAEKRIAKAGK